jgi:serine/threonine-protein kinase
VAEASSSSLLIDDIRRRLGERYDIVRELGRGGMGMVLLARDRALDRPVALKVLPPEFAAQSDLRERFLRETRMAAGFSHPNIVPVFAVEECDGMLAFAMGFVEGESVAERVRRTGPLTTRDTVRLLTDVGYALAYAHGRGVVHRDIKPDNIMLERATGRALVMDFGIARTVGAAPASGTRPNLTRVGEVVGTPEFMSPEQASGDVVDGRSDLYSLGLVAFFAVSGQFAITGSTTAQILARQLTQPVPPVGTLRPDLPAPLAEIIDRLARKEPAERFGTAEELTTALDSAQLASADVPLPIRLLAQDLAQLGIVAIFLLVIVFMMQRTALHDGENLHIGLPAVFLVAVMWGRVTTTFAAARGVVEAGFAPKEILAGFGRILDEHAADRARLRMVPTAVARRTRAVRVMLGVVVLALVLIWLALAERVQVEPGRYRIPRPMVAVLVGAVFMLGVAFIGLVRSPFRTTAGERMFRRIWMGPPGKALLRRAARGVVMPAGAVTSPAITAPPAKTVSLSDARTVARGEAHTGQRASAEAARLARLEARVEALERWRDADVP